MKLIIAISQSITDTATIKEFFHVHAFYPDYQTLPDELIAYNDFASLVRQQYDKAILFTKDIVSPFLVFSKVTRIRATPIMDEFTAKATVAHNDAQIAIVPLNIVSTHYGLLLAKVFLDSQFEGGIHEERISMLEALS